LSAAGSAEMHVLATPPKDFGSAPLVDQR